MIIGCKFLTSDSKSLTDEFDKVTYPINEWVTVPGNGCYVAITGNLTSGGTGPILAYLECEEPTGAPAPEGVICYRRVRRLPDPSPDITPELKGEVARDAPDLTSTQRIELAMLSTKEQRGWVAYYAPDLTDEQRAKLRK